jgi:hypothetical protein
MSSPTRAFFSFPEVLDPARHRDYNAWHQLDHRPENLALDGVVHGDRWVRTPACRAASAVDLDPELGAAHYVAMYWFREPAGPSIREWRELGTTTLEQGRRPELAWTRRRHTGFYRPLEGLVAPGVPVSARAVPHRPHRGVVLEVLRAEEPTDPRSEAGFGRHRADLTAAMGLPGVVGAWSFGSREVSGASPDGSTRIALLWCDDDPCAVAAEMPEPLEGAGLRTVLRTPLLSIRPHEWDWFDAVQDQAGGSRSTSEASESSCST